MVRGLAFLGLFMCVVFGCAVLGGRLLHRRWDREGFYE